MSMDPHACGTQGYDCLGGACVQGVCQPVELASLRDASYVAVDASDVTWSNNSGTFGWAPKDGFAPLHTGKGVAGSIAGIATTPGFLHLAAMSAGVLTVDKRDGAQSLTKGEGMATAVATRGDEVYAAIGRTLYRVEALELTPLADGAHLALAADARGVYFSDYGELCIAFCMSTCSREASVYALMDGSTERTVLGPGHVSLRGLAADGDAVYWLDQCTRELLAKPHGGAVVRLGADLAGPIAVDDRFVYVYSHARPPPPSWGTPPPPDYPSRLVRVPKRGGEQQILLELPKIADIAVDDRRLYLVEAGVSGKILAVAKPPP